MRGKCGHIQYHLPMSTFASFALLHYGSSIFVLLRIVSSPTRHDARNTPHKSILGSHPGAELGYWGDD